MIYKMLLRIMLMGLVKVGICVIMSVNQKYYSILDKYNGGLLWSRF